jgi:hypothetical protein
LQHIFATYFLNLNIKPWNIKRAMEQHIFAVGSIRAARNGNS